MCDLTPKEIEAIDAAFKLAKEVGKYLPEIGTKEHREAMKNTHKRIMKTLHGSIR